MRKGAGHELQKVCYQMVIFLVASHLNFCMSVLLLSIKSGCWLVKTALLEEKSLQALSIPILWGGGGDTYDAPPLESHAIRQLLGNSLGDTL